MSKEVEAWIRRNNRKRAKLISYENGQYTIVYFDKNKVRVGNVSDGMLARYGIGCYGAMYSTDRLSLWQSVAGACNETEVEIMISYLKGECKLPDFDFSQIKDVKH